jgi:hypothetical protein
VVQGSIVVLTSLMFDCIAIISIACFLIKLNCCLHQVCLVLKEQSLATCMPLRNHYCKRGPQEWAQIFCISQPNYKREDCLDPLAHHWSDLRCGSPPPLLSPLGPPAWPPPPRRRQRIPARRTNSSSPAPPASHDPA